MKTALPFILLGLLAGSIAAFWSLKEPQQPSNWLSFADAVDVAAPAVVNIYTTKAAEITPEQPEHNNPFLNLYQDQQKRRMQQQKELSLGSGVILSRQGFILTNYHVIKDAEEILVLLFDGRKTLATIEGIDKATDLAVLKIHLDNLQPIAIGDSKTMRVGDPVLTIGNPYGFGQSVSAGILSGKGRYGLNLNTYEDFLQTDAAINIGSSGGALTNPSGQLIGINTALYSRTGGSQGIGLAIPIEIAQKVLNDIIQYGYVIRGWLGLEAAQINPQLAKQLGLKTTQGIVVTNLFHNSPAAKAGILVGDIITHIDGEAITTGHKGLLEVANLLPGKKITTTLIREGTAYKTTVIIGQRPHIEQ